MMMRLLLVLSLALTVSHAFHVSPPLALTVNRARRNTASSLTAPSSSSSSRPASPPLVLFLAKDPSRSGSKQDRLNRLAELEEDRVETDKGFVVKAAGGFVALIVILIAAAAASGLLTQY